MNLEEKKYCNNITEYKSIFGYKTIKAILRKYSRDVVFDALSLVDLDKDERIINGNYYSKRKINQLGFSVRCRFLIALGIIDNKKIFVLPKLVETSGFLELSGWSDIVSKLKNRAIDIIIE